MTEHHYVVESCENTEAPVFSLLRICRTKKAAETYKKEIELNHMRRYWNGLVRVRKVEYHNDQ